MAPRHDYFISFGGPDLEWAEWVADVLEREGHTVLSQKRDMVPGTNIVSLTQQGALAERTIVLLSPDYFDRDFPEAEWAAAFFQDPVGLARKLVPVMVRRCKPPGLLGPIVYVQLVGLERDKAREVLLAGLKPGRNVPASPPPFPGKA